MFGSVASVVDSSGFLILCNVGNSRSSEENSGENCRLLRFTCFQKVSYGLGSFPSFPKIRVLGLLGISVPRAACSSLAFEIVWPGFVLSL